MGFLVGLLTKDQPAYSSSRIPPRFIRLPQVVEMTGMGKTFIYSRISDGTFPKQIQLGSRSVVWNERDVIDWMNQQIATAT